MKDQLPNDSRNPWKTIKRKRVYDNPWIEVEHRDVINPSGNPGIYGVVHFKNLAIGILPLDELYNTWLIGQYRYTLNAYSWEIPEGGGKLGQDPLQSAKRELLEETGIVASKWTKLLELHTSNSVTDEFGLAYIAQGLSFGEAEPEETEELICKKVPFKQALDMVMTGEITDALAMCTIFKTAQWIDAGKI